MSKPLSVTKKQHCYDELVQRILTLEIEPGAVLDETLLAEEYELSRTPLREVIQRLAGEGYLTLEENRGAKVSSMDVVHMRNFFQTAPMIYATTARLAAENANAEQLEELRKVQAEFRKAGENADTQRLAMQNHLFHRIIGRMSGNQYLYPSLNRLLIDHTRMGQMFYRPLNSKEHLMVWEACDQHDQMIEAIENQNPEKIVELTIEHWKLSQDRIEKFVRPDPLNESLDTRRAGE